MKKYSLLALSIFACFTLITLHAESTYATPYSFATLAGSDGVAGSIDGAGGAARFNFPSGVAIDGSGNLYVADRSTGTVRKITPAGVVTTLAGTAGVPGSTDSTGDHARFNNPTGVAVDGSGNVYVADQTNNTIRRISAAGVVVTVAGSAGLAGSTDGAASAARFTSPTSVAVDSLGNAYVADQGNQTIRKITPAGVVTTLAGSAGLSGSTDGTGGAARFSLPTGVAVDGSGNVYVADQANDTIRKITPAGVVITLAGSAGLSGSTDGTGSAARFFHPEGVAADGSGNVYVSDSGNHTIRKVTAAGAVITLAGTATSSGSTDGTGSAARFFSPDGVAVDGAGIVYVADYANHSIRTITAAGVVTTLAGAPGFPGLADGTAVAVGAAITGRGARFKNPFGVATDGAGNIYVADSYNSTIRKITAAGAVTTLAGVAGLEGSTDGMGSTARFYRPVGAAVDGSGNVYVADYNNYTIRKITAAGVVTTLAGTTGTIGSANGTGTAAQFNQPVGVAVDGAGNVFVADNGNHVIRKITAAGVVTTFAGTAGSSGSTDGTGSAARFYYPYCLAIDGSGNLYVADNGNSTIRKITAAGVVTTLAGTPLSTGSTDGTGSAARFKLPTDVAVDGAGNVFVADNSNNTIRKVTPAGVVTTFAGSAGSTGSTDGTGSAARFNDPTSVATDGAGNVYVADDANCTIRKITPAGVVTTLAGAAGSVGSTDAPGTPAGFKNPEGVAVDGSGNVYVADTSNSTIRKTTAAGAVTTIAGSAGLTGTTDGTGGAARFNTPMSVAVDGSGNVYVADHNNSTIRKITAAGAVTTFAGLAGASGATDATGSLARFFAPSGVAVDLAGNVYVADSSNNTIRKITPAAVVTTLAGLSTASGSANGTGSAARFLNPCAVTVDKSGNVYVADRDNNTIRKVTAAGVVTTLAGTAGTQGSTDGTGAAARFNTPSGVGVDGLGNVYVSEYGNSSIRKITPAGVVTTLAGGAGTSGSVDGLGSAVRFSGPQGLAVDGSGNVFVADSGNNTIRRGILQTGNLDFNNDGNADLLFQNTVTGESFIWLMNGTAFSSSISLGIMSADWSPAATGDFNADGKTDIIWQNTVTGERAVWFMNGSTFVSGLSLGVVPTDWSIAGTGDFNADGQTDLVWQNKSTGERSIWLMNGGVFQLGVSLGVVSTDWWIGGVGDFNADGKPDLVWQNTLTGERRIWLMNGTSLGSIVSLGIMSTQLQISGTGDYNGDGKPDILWSNTVTGERTVSLMSGTTITGTVSIATVPVEWVLNHPGPRAVVGIAADDFNGDGNSDLVWQNRVTGERAIWLMNGGVYQSGISLGVIPTAWSIAGTGDFNGDGQTDIVWQNTSTGERAIWLMNGGAYQSGISLGIVPPVWSIVDTGDFNGDGKPDLVWQNTATGERVIWLMNGGAYMSGLTIGIVPVEWSIAGIGDFNGDGKPDIVWQNTSTGERSIWLMNGAVYQSGISLGVVPVEWSIAGTGDFNGDRKSDIIWQNTVTGERAIWLMNGGVFLSGVSQGVYSTDWQVRN